MDDVFAQCLNQSESRFLQGYMALNPGGAFSLNQDPDVMPMMSSGSALWMNQSHGQTIL